MGQDLSAARFINFKNFYQLFEKVRNIDEVLCYHRLPSLDFPIFVLRTHALFFYPDCGGIMCLLRRDSHIHHGRTVRITCRISSLSNTSKISVCFITYIIICILSFPCRPMQETRVLQPLAIMYIHCGKTSF